MPRYVTDGTGFYEITNIYGGAFNNSKLTGNLTFPQGLTSMGSDGTVLGGEINLTISSPLPDSLTEIVGDFVGSQNPIT
jgi:hypothetical protein